MKLGFIGLGKMGSNMVLHLLEQKHQPVVYDVNYQLVQKLAQEGAISSHTIPELAALLPSPRVVWVMVPAKKVDEVLTELIPALSPGDIVIEGGNSYFQDSIARSQMLQKKGIYFLDCGVSGGLEGARYGASIMVGGENKIFQKMEPLFKDLSIEKGYGHMGKSGAGHFVKMVHNGIEYGMMGAIAEGMQAIQEGPFDTDLKTVARVYAHGSIIQSRLLSWLTGVCDLPGYLDSISGEVPLGETEEEMAKLEKIAPMPVLTAARITRAETRRTPCFAGKIIAAMRNQFGGHSFNKKSVKL